MALKATVIVVFCAGLLVVPSFAQQTSEAELRAVMAEGLKASLSGDEKTIAAMIADDYLQTDISGHVQDKTTWLKEYFVPVAELIRAGKFRWERYERKDLQFRFYGDSAVVMGKLEVKGVGAKWSLQQHTWVADPDASFSGTLCFTHIYVKRNGKWLLGALQNAVPVSPQPSKP